MTDQSRTKALAEVARLRERGRFEEARERLSALVGRFPDDGEVAYCAAAVHDRLGLESQAVALYERCLRDDGLPDEDRRGALLGLGSTYRVLGRYADAVGTLRDGVARYPDDGALRTFLAMALYNTGAHHEAVRTLLKLLAATSGDADVRSYRRAIELYAEDLDRTV